MVRLRTGRRREAPDELPARPSTVTANQPAAGPSAASPDQPPAGTSTPAPEYATLGPDAPIAWPSGARRVPVTGQLSPHAAAALERMGITKAGE